MTKTPTHLKVFFGLTTFAYTAAFFLPFDRAAFIELIYQGILAIANQEISSNEWALVLVIFLPLLASPVYFFAFWKTTLFHRHRRFKLLLFLCSLMPLLGLSFFLFKREGWSVQFIGAYVWIFVHFSFFLLYWLRIRHWQQASHQLEISDHLLDQD